MMLISITAVVVMVFVTVYVKVSIRGWDGGDVMDIYTMTRIDFLKDDRVRFAIYSMLNPDKVTILPNVGQTIFPIITWFYPLNTILSQYGYTYLSYQDYFSEALQHVVEAPFMTTSIFAELISNFGLLGIVFMYCLMVMFAKYATVKNYPLRAILLISFVALQMYTTRYLAIFFEMSIIYIIGGAAAIIFGGDMVVDNASKIAENFGMSKTLVGLTIVAIGTSLPELVTSIVAARKGNSGIAIGNAVGSSIFNILFILGIASSLSPIKVDKDLLVDAAILIGVSLITYIFAKTGESTSRFEGVIMVGCYCAYTAYIIARCYAF